MEFALYKLIIIIITFTYVHSWSLSSTHEKLPVFPPAKFHHDQGGDRYDNSTKCDGLMHSRTTHHIILTNWQHWLGLCWDTLVRTNVTADLDPPRIWTPTKTLLLPNSGSRTRNKRELTHQLTFWNGDIHCLSFSAMQKEVTSFLNLGHLRFSTKRSPRGKSVVIIIKNNNKDLY